MRRTTFFLIVVALMALTSCSGEPPAPAAPPNPLLQEWTTPFQVPPFHEIRPEHILPAIKVAIDEQRKEVDAIAGSTELPTFANTVEALERSGKLLSRVNGVFSNVSSANTNAELQAVNRETAPLLTALRDDIQLNPKLFQRVKAVCDSRSTLSLTAEQQKLLEDRYKSFVRGGANLDEAAKTRLRQINTELSSLGVKFADGKAQFSLRGLNLLNQEVLQHIYGDIMRVSVLAELRFFTR
ncbi:MAG: hypothetical protein EHM13_15220 [Acidobacteria bacterium]|nr:MAG: hypothetical protein EHM13_15220 [Acidobacteriota bacterium]